MFGKETLRWLVLVGLILGALYVATHQAHAQVYDPPPYGWGPYDGGPQGPPRRSGYGWREPPYPLPGRRGPQRDPCIYRGECGEPLPYRVPRPRSDW